VWFCSRGLVAKLAFSSQGFPTFTVGMCKDFFYILVQFQFSFWKDSDSVWNEFGSVWLNEKHGVIWML